MGRMFLFVTLIVGGIALVAVTVYMFPQNKETWITAIPIAHRGLFNNEKNIPENSMMAFKKAVESGYAIELDVHLTKDNYVIVHHDFDLNRLSGVDKRLEDMTLKEIQSHPLLKTNEVPPTLKEVVEFVKGKVPLYVEIKQKKGSVAGALEAETLKVLEGYSGRVAILSFNTPSLEWFAKKAPHYHRGQNYAPTESEEGIGYQVVASVLSKSWFSQPHFIVYNHAKMPDFVLGFLGHFRELVSYNIKSKDDYKMASKYATNVIFENINL